MTGDLAYKLKTLKLTVGAMRELQRSSAVAPKGPSLDRVLRACKDLEDKVNKMLGEI